MLNRLGERIGRCRVEKELKKLESSAVDLAEFPPKEAWVLFIMDSEKDFHSVRDFLERLKETYGIEHVLGYALLPDDEVPNMATGARHMEYIRSKDIAWAGNLKWDPLESSDQGGPDLLIDLTNGRSVAMDRLMGQTPAGLRIGRYQAERVAFYDLMFEVENDEGLEEWCDRTFRYLGHLMNKTEQP